MELGARLEEVRKWAGEWERATRGPCAWSTKRSAAGLIGADQIPGRAWVDGYEQAWALLGAAGRSAGWRS